MFSGGNRTTSATWNVKADKLTLRPYNAALGDLSGSICTELGHNGSTDEKFDRCVFETRTAFDCLLRHRVTKGGDITDNISACKFHINNMKDAIARSEFDKRLLDDKLTTLNDMRKSFV